MAVAVALAVAVAPVRCELATDEWGKTSVWVKRYRADRPGTGFVQLWGLGASVERLPMVRAAAEYGLTRGASP